MGWQIRAPYHRTLNFASRQCPSGARRKGQVGDNKGSRTCARHSMLRVQLLQSNEFPSTGDIFEASPKLERGDALMSSTEFQLKFFLSWQPRLKQSKTPSLIYPGPKIGKRNSSRHLRGHPQQRSGTLTSWEILFHSSPLVAFSSR